MTTTATPSHPPPPVPNTLAAAAAPVVSSVVPNSGPTTGGTAVVISGSGFTAGEAVFAQIPAPGGLSGFTETTVNPDGTSARRPNTSSPKASSRSPKRR